MLISRIFAVSVALLSAVPAPALTPAAETMLKGLGLDPASKEVLAIAKDRVKAVSGEVYTLDGLAAKGDVAAVKAFLVTRDFFRDFRENWDIEFPNDELYDIRYLSAAERAYMARQLMQGLPAKPKRPSRR